MRRVSDSKAERAIGLIERAALYPARMAWLLREPCSYMDGDARFRRAMQLLSHLLEFIDDQDAPDGDFWRDYFILEGSHMILTDEGWEPGEAKAAYLEENPDWTPNDEVNGSETNCTR